MSFEFCGSPGFELTGKYIVPSLESTPSGTPALAHAWAHALWPAPEATFVVLQFKSTTCPVIVISPPAIFSCACAAREGSAQKANAAVVARMRFSIVHAPMGEFRTTGENRSGNETLLPSTIRPDRGFQISRILGAMAEAYRELLDTFGRGWERGAVDEIASVFAPDAVFLETPFSAKSVGIEAIRAYWNDIPQNQADVTFKSGELFVAGAWFATEFRCTYRRRRSGEWVDARGAMFCETKGGKITEMRMYWHRS